MPVQDRHPKLTLSVEQTANLIALLAENIGTGRLQGSTELMRAAALLCRRVDRLYRVVELDMSVQLSEARVRELAPAEVTS